MPRTRDVPKKDIEVARPIKLILSDVDGIMTDGSITIDNMGVETKTFHVRDGLGIKLWQRSGFQFGLITARNSQVVKLRAAELGIELVRQGATEKLPVARQIFEQLDIDPSEVAYIGDDLQDLPVLWEVGLPVTVSDGVEEVKQASHWLLNASGGSGALRELCERLLRAKGIWDQCLPVRAAN